MYIKTNNLCENPIIYDKASVKICSSILKKKKKTFLFNKSFVKFTKN